MKRTILIEVLAGVAVLGFLAADASAMYHPGAGRFMQRDPISDRAESPRLPESLSLPIESSSRLPVGSVVAKAEVRAILKTLDHVMSDVLAGHPQLLQYADGPNVYECVSSRPITSHDPSGLDRYVGFDGAHAYLLIEERNAGGSVTGYARVDFVPTYSVWNILKAVSLGGTASVAVNHQTFKDKPPGIRYSSTPCGDKDVLKQLEKMAAEKEQLYWHVLFRNCTHFSEQWATQCSDEPPNS